jgi:hypothetical protein
MRARLRHLATMAVVLAALVLAAGPALAAPDVPPDVREALSGDGLQRMLSPSQQDPGTPDLTYAVVGAVHRLHTFVPGFYRGRPTPDPVTETDEWLGVLQRGDRVLGLVRVWRPEGAPAELAAWAGDVEIGTALLGIGPDEVVVLDEPGAAYYAWDGARLRPLNDLARDELPGGGSIGKLQAAVATRSALSAQQESGLVTGDLIRLFVLIAVVVLPLAVVGMLTVRDQRRPPRYQR